MRFIDLIFQRYSTPMALIDMMIRTGRLSEFVEDLLKIYIDEKRDKTYWDIWLYRIFDKTYPEFLESIAIDSDQPKIDAVATVTQSMNVLNGFSPE